MIDDDGPTPPNDPYGLWEHQGRPLTVERLLFVLRQVDPQTVVEIEHYDGMGTTRELRLMHIDPRGEPVEAVVFTTVD